LSTNSSIAHLSSLTNLKSSAMYGRATSQMLRYHVPKSETCQNYPRPNLSLMERLTSSQCKESRRLVCTTRILQLGEPFGEDFGAVVESVKLYTSDWVQPCLGAVVSLTVAVNTVPGSWNQGGSQNFISARRIVRDEEVGSFQRTRLRLSSNLGKPTV